MINHISHATEPSNLERPRVLVVADNVVHQRFDRRMLDSLGCDAVVAPSGWDALKDADVEYDLVLLDLDVYEIDGPGLSRRLCATTRLKNRPPFIAILGECDLDVVKAYVAAGVDEMLPRPLSRDALTAALSRWVPVAPAVN